MGKRTNIVSSDEIFVGRVGESAALTDALRAGERLVSLIGPSGMGKTRLAREVALRLRSSFEEGGVWFCDLSAAETREELITVVAMALGISSGGKDGELPLVRPLANRGRLLLVLDNFEYLEEQALPLVASWLDQAPKLQIIVTSLARLGLEGESLYELRPLEPEEASLLYIERARRAWAGDRPFYSGERRAIDELVQRLDRLPLAIELAAARVRVLPPRAMLNRIEERLELLRSRRGGRHSSLEHALHCSWELLEPEEQLTLARASIFKGGFTLEAAETILALDGEGDTAGERRGGAVLEVLESLRDKALLQLDTSHPPRFSLYESVQAFASRELARLGGEEIPARRHTRYFLEWGERLIGQRDGLNDGLVVDSLVADRENLLAVQRRHFQSDPASAVRAGLAASIALARAGSPAARLELARASVEAARRAGDPVLLGKALYTQFSVLNRDGRLDESRRSIDEALDLAQRSGERKLEGNLWSDSGMLRWSIGDLDGTEADLARAAVIASEVDDPALVGHIHTGLALLADSRGRFDEARRNFEEACDIFRRIGSIRHHARALFNLSTFLSNEGKIEPARVAMEEARRLFRLAAETGSEAIVLMALGSMELAAGNLDAAEANLNAALPIMRNEGIRASEGLILARLGIVALEREETQLARQRIQDGLAVIEEIGNRYLGDQLLPFHAAVCAVFGQTEEAGAAFEEARARFRAKGDEPGIALVELLESFLDLALARLALQGLRIEEAESLQTRASARYMAAIDAPPSQGLQQALRLVGRAIERFGATRQQGEGSARTRESGHDADGSSQRRVDDALPIGVPNGLDRDDSGLSLGPNAEWFEIADRPRIDMARRDAERRMLLALVGQRLCAPGLGISTDKLFQAGWPGEQVPPETASNRVYTGIDRLRRSGLGRILLRNADGYVLSASIPVSLTR